MTSASLPESTPPSPRAAHDPTETAVVKLDHRGRVLVLPQTTDAVLTCSPDECAGRSIDEVLPDPVSTRILEMVQHADAEAPPMAADVYHPAVQRWFDVRVQPTADAVTVTLRDRTARKQWTTLLHLLDTTVLEGLWRVSAEGTIVTANATFARFLGYDNPADLEGRDVTCLFADAEGAPDWAALRTAAAEEGAVEQVPCRFRRRDGTCVQGRTHLTAVHGRAGQVTAFEGSVIENTADGNAGTRQGLLERAVEATEDAVAVTEAGPLEAPRIVYVNAAFTALTGYPAEKAVGRTPRLLYGAGTDRDVLGTLRDHVKGGHPFRGETVLYRRNGTPYVSQWSVAPVRDENGTITHWVTVQRDVTEQRDAEAALRERGERIEALYTALDSLLEATTIHQVATEATALVTDTLGLSGAIVREAGTGELAPLATRGDVPAVDPVDLDEAGSLARGLRGGPRRRPALGGCDGRHGGR